MDETDQQKYDRRIKELAVFLSSFIIQFKCENQLTIPARVSMTPVTNQFDTTLDGIQSNVTFEQ